MSFMAEVFPGKQKYLADRFPGVPIFMDVCDMGRNNAPTVDGYSLAVPKVAI